MTQESKLNINTEISADGALYAFILSGQMDVTAGVALSTLNETPANIQVVLDFAAVERINSMGLAQLLKLLELWKKNNIKIEARNLNRMISMLFKMTGLNRYFSQGAQALESAPAPATTTAHNPAVQATVENRAAPKLRQIRRVRRVDGGTQKLVDAKLKFAVSLQSNQQLTGWYFFNTFLQRRLEKAISVDVNQSGQISDLQDNALVFAKPFDACVLIKEHHFIPVARPINDTDEVSIIVSKSNAEKNITDFSGASVVTAMQANFVYLLGRFMCDECELDSSQLQYTYTGNEIKALQMLLKGEADMLFMLKKNYHELSRLSREQTYLLDESETAMAYHMLLVAPEHKDLRQPLIDTLCHLHEDEKGLQVLSDLGMSGWCKPEPDELDMLLILYERYATGIAAS
ncbi:MAG: PhnD/SsuA/transferrin family substrate-binding protein [Methylococcaceae bacterium]|nr:PhnD/SsuA/transferrin family substrate-binding protein [Methylococcaceae bacterium]